MITRGGDEVVRNRAIGQRLRELRTTAHLSLSDLGRLANYDPSVISRIENGVRTPSAQFATACDDALNTGGELSRLLDSSHFDLLPAAMLIGRDREVTNLVRWLDPAEPWATGQSKVCVLHGMGGIGKTLLAAEVGNLVSDWFPDGCIYLDLRGYSLEVRPISENEALERVLRKLGVPARALPAEFDDRAAMLRSELRDRRILFVLDSVATIRQIRALLPRDPRSAVIITSRRRLTALDQAFHLEVRGLSRQASANLFRSVSQLDTSSSNRDEPGKVDSIVTLCHYVPLAIRIAAARFRDNTTRTLTDIEKGLSDRTSLFLELDDGERSLAATFAESCATLPADEYRMLALMALHPGIKVNNESAAALLGTVPTEAGILLDKLLRSGMLEPFSVGSYRLHDLFRDYLRQHESVTLQMTERESAVARLCDYYLRAASAADLLIAKNRHRFDLSLSSRPPFAIDFLDEGGAREWMRYELDNFLSIARLMLGCQAYEVCWQFIYCLRGYLFEEKPSWNTWIESFQIAVEAARCSANRLAEAISLNNLGLALLEQGDSARSGECYAVAQRIFMEIGDLNGEINVVANYAWLFYYKEDYPRALEMAQRALEFYASTRQRANAAIAMDCIGRCQLRMMQPENAATILQEALSEFEAMNFKPSHLTQVKRLLAEIISLNMTGGNVERSALTSTGDLSQLPPESKKDALELEVIMGDKYIISGPTGAIGRNARAKEMVLQQIIPLSTTQLDLPALGLELETLRQELRRQAVTREQDASVAEIAAAATAADEGDQTEAFRRLKRAGHWALSTATGIGTDLAVAALKTALRFNQ